MTFDELVESEIESLEEISRVVDTLKSLPYRADIVWNATEKMFFVAFFKNNKPFPPETTRPATSIESARQLARIGLERLSSMRS